MTAPTRCSKGYITEDEREYRVRWSENKVPKSKTFNKMCNKRTDAESKRLAEEYHAEIIKKHQEWVDSLPKKVKKEKSFKTYPFTYNERVDQVHCSICDHYFQKKSLWKHKITPTHTKNVARTELLIAAGE